MLQWTREGQETLQVARRQHNGGIECFRKRDYAASKRFLQNALAIRKTVLSHSHPIILGNIEMLSIVSELAQNAQKHGCGVQPTLFLTAEPQQAIDREQDEQCLVTGIATIAQLARLKMRNDPAINERFNPASPTFTLFKSIDGVTIDPCLVEQHTNKEELKMILWELFYLQQLRLGPYHVDTQLTLTRLWEIATDTGDTVTAEALGKRIWEMRTTPPSQRRAVTLDLAMGYPGGLPEENSSADYILPPMAHPSTLLFATPPAASQSNTNAANTNAATAQGRVNQLMQSQQQKQPIYSDLDFMLSNLVRKAPTGGARGAAAGRSKGVEGITASAGGGSGAGGGGGGGGLSSGGAVNSGLANFYSVQPKIERKIAMLDDDSWEKELRRKLGVDKDVTELLADGGCNHHADLLRKRREKKDSSLAGVSLSPRPSSTTLAASTNNADAGLNNSAAVAVSLSAHQQQQQDGGNGSAAGRSPPPPSLGGDRYPIAHLHPYSLEDGVKDGEGRRYYDTDDDVRPRSFGEDPLRSYEQQQQQQLPTHHHDHHYDDGFGAHPPPPPPDAEEEAN